VSAEEIAGVPVRASALRALLTVSSRPVSCRDAAEREGKDLASRDRALLTHLVSGTTRHRMTLDHLLSRHSRRGIQELDAPVREAMRLGAFQLCFCLRIPPHAALGTTVEAVKAFSPRGAGMVNAVLRALASGIAGRGESLPTEDVLRVLPDGEGNVCRFRDPMLPNGDPRSPSLLAIRSSLPVWLLERWIRRFGPEEAETLAFEALRTPSIALRPNPGRPLPEALMALCERLPSPSGALLLKENRDPTGLPGWEEGAFSVQDAAAQAVVRDGLLPKPEELLLDLCAGVGGKACAAAEAGSRVTAVDQETRRLERLRATANRLGLSDRIEAVEADALKPPSAWQGAFDAVLLDAPCTNTGVLRRRPEARWRLKPEDPARMAAMQARLLEAASACVKPGGRLVYATCSLEEEENEGIALAFAAAHAGFKPEAGSFQKPSRTRDGAFWSRLRRTP